MSNSELITVDQKRGYLKALDAPIFRGVDYVSYEGNQIKYRSLADMLAVRDLLRGELGMKPTSSRRRPRRGVVNI